MYIRAQARLSRKNNANYLVYYNKLPQSMRLIDGVGGWEKLSKRGAMRNKTRGKNANAMRCVKCEMRNAKCGASLCPSPIVHLSPLLFTQSPAQLGTPLFLTSISAHTFILAPFSVPRVSPPLSSSMAGPVVRQLHVG